jgi:hypothetical protein
MLSPYEGVTMSEKLILVLLALFGTVSAQAVFPNQALIASSEIEEEVSDEELLADEEELLIEEASDAEVALLDEADAEEE